jgi:hypothetical protein
MTSSTLDNIRRGAGFGLAMGIGFTAIAAATWQPRTSERLGITLGVAATMYVVGGVVLGAITGAVRDRVRTRGSAVLAGFLIGLPTAFVLYVYRFGLARTLEMWPVVPVAALLLGGGLGFVLYSPPEPIVPAPPPSRLRTVSPPEDESRPEA